MEKERQKFGEEQQWLRMDSGNHPPNTNSFITVIDECTDFENWIFESFLYRNKENEALGDRKIKYRNADLLEAVEELRGFINNLSKFNLKISSTIIRKYKFSAL